MKSLFSGMALAAVAGLLTGGAMKPNLGTDDRPAGPQMFAGGSGVRSTGPFDDGMTFASYNGQIPDYVLGTDWQKTLAWPEAAQEVHDAHEPPIEVVAADPEPQPVVFSRRASEEPQAEPVTYPSMNGGAIYGPEADSPPTPPEPPKAPSFG